MHAHLDSWGNDTFVHGTFDFSNETLGTQLFSGTVTDHVSYLDTAYLYKSESGPKFVYMDSFSALGCYRPPDHAFWTQPFPWWTASFLVPLYCLCSSLSNLQDWRSPQLLVMVVFSMVSWTANRLTSYFLPGKSDIVSATGALVIGVLGNLYARIVGGPAFTTMVTGVMFLVPVSSDRNICWHLVFN